MTWELTNTWQGKKVKLSLCIIIYAPSLTSVLEVSCQLHAPDALPPGKEPWYPLERRLGGPQSQSGRCGKDKNPCPYWESNPGNPARSPPLYWLDKYMKPEILTAVTEDYCLLG
jgi:hypothetical protein